MILSRRALTSSDKAGGAAGGASKGEPALDGGASSLGDDATGAGPSGIAISAMRRRKTMVKPENRGQEASSVRSRRTMIKYGGAWTRRGFV